MSHTSAPDSTSRDRRAGAHDGFSLLEVMVALSILMVGLLGLAQVFYVGVSTAATSSDAVVAREKAREAIESVHTARDARTTQWAAIRNRTAPVGCPAGTTGSTNGIFESADLDLQAAGPDGLVNTNDDTGEEMTPGIDNILGTGDDVPMRGFSRQIAICDIPGNVNLRMIIVTIRYNGSRAVGLARRTYQLTTFISSFS